MQGERKRHQSLNGPRQRFAAAMGAHQREHALQPIPVEPAVIDQGLKDAEEWSRKMSDEVMTRFRAEMKKKGHDL